MYTLFFKDILDISHISSSVKRKGIPCIRVITMKKTEFITLRTDPQVKAALAAIGAENKWSLSQVSEEIVRQWLEEHRPELLQEEA